MAADTHERTFGLTMFRSIAAGATDLAINGVYPRAISVTGAGTITVIGVDDSQGVVIQMAAGVFQPICAKQITAASATGIVAGY